MAVRGAQFVTDSDGQRIAVLLDLKEWGELWEDIYDKMLADEHAGESRMPLEEFETELRAEGLLNE